MSQPQKQWRRELRQCLRPPPHLQHSPVEADVAASQPVHHLPPRNTKSVPGLMRNTEADATQKKFRGKERTRSAAVCPRCLCAGHLNGACCFW